MKPKTFVWVTVDRITDYELGGLITLSSKPGGPSAGIGVVRRKNPSTNQVFVEILDRPKGSA